MYSDAAIDHLRFVKRCRDLGFSIAQVKALLALSSHTTQCAEAMAIGTHHLEAVQKEIADLQELESALLEMLDHCSAGREECPMLRQLFAD
jgi:MerR family mercuric resistance operon transcriptional regulator